MELPANIASAATPPGPRPGGESLRDSPSANAIVGGEIPRPEATTFRFCDPHRDGIWDSRLHSCPGGSFFHSSPWARVLELTYGFKPAYGLVEREDTTAALLPSMEVQSWLTGRRGITLPFTDECAVVCDQPGISGQMFRQMLRIGSRRSWKYYEVRGRGNLPGDLPASV